MKISVSAAALLVFCAAGARAQGVFVPPAFRAAKLSPAFGARPAATKIPMLTTLETYRKTRVVVPLGDRDYHLAIQLTRDDEWVLTLLPVGKNKFELEAALMFLELRKGAERTFGGRDYAITLDESGDPSRHAVVFRAKDNPLGGMSVPVGVLKRGVYARAVPLPSIGPDWRLLYQIDLFRGAGMRSFTFLRETRDGIEFYRTGAEAVDWERPVVREVGGIKVSLIIETGTGSVLVSPAPKE